VRQSLTAFFSYSDKYERLYPCLENIENEGSTNLITREKMDSDQVQILLKRKTNINGDINASKKPSNPYIKTATILLPLTMILVKIIHSINQMSAVYL